MGIEKSGIACFYSGSTFVSRNSTYFLRIYLYNLLHRNAQKRTQPNELQISVGNFILQSQEGTFFFRSSKVLLVLR